MYSIELINKFLSMYTDVEELMEKTKSADVKPIHLIDDTCKLNLSNVDDLRKLYERVNLDYHIFLYNTVEEFKNNNYNTVSDAVDSNAYKISGYKLIVEYLLDCINWIMATNDLETLCEDNSIEFINNSVVTIDDIKTFNNTTDLLHEIYECAYNHSYYEIINKNDIIYALEYIVNEKESTDKFVKALTTDLF